MDLKDVALLVSIIVAIASIGGTLISTFTQLSIKNEVAGVNSIVANWRADALEERNKDKEDLKKWIEDRFMASKDAEGRMKRLEDDSRSINSRCDSHDIRLRHIEQFRHTPNRSLPEARQ